MNGLEQLVVKAVKGDKKSLEKIVLQIQDTVYNLAIRMLWHPEDAKDATQDILIRIITNLSSFNHKSAFKTWVYRLACNALLNFKKKKFLNAISFEEYELQLSKGLNNTIEYTTNIAEQKLLIQEAKIGCSNAMLQCLSSENRLIYIMGEILEFTGKEAAFVLGITPENFRKKLSRTRKNLYHFLTNNCGLVNTKNTCRCYKKVDDAIQNNRIDPNNLLFSKNIKNIQLMQEIEQVRDEVSLYQSNPEYNTPEILLKEVKRIVTAIQK